MACPLTADFTVTVICKKLFQCEMFPVSSILQALLVIQKSWVVLKNFWDLKPCNNAYLVFPSAFQCLNLRGYTEVTFSDFSA